MNHLGWRVGRSHTPPIPWAVGWVLPYRFGRKNEPPHSDGYKSRPSLWFLIDSRALPKARGEGNSTGLSHRVTNSVTLVPIFPQWLRRFQGCVTPVTPHRTKHKLFLIPWIVWKSFVVWRAGLWHGSKPWSHWFWLLWLQAAPWRRWFHFQPCFWELI